MLPASIGAWLLLSVDTAAATARHAAAAARASAPTQGQAARWPALVTGGAHLLPLGCGPAGSSTSRSRCRLGRLATGSGGGGGTAAAAGAPASGTGRAGAPLLMVAQKLALHPEFQRPGSTGRPSARVAHLGMSTFGRPLGWTWYILGASNFAFNCDCFRLPLGRPARFRLGPRRPVSLRLCTHDHADVPHDAFRVTLHLVLHA